MRQKLIGADLIECVLGLGPNLFYNSPMEACVVVCRASKPKSRTGKILFINAVNEVSRERAQSFLTDEHIRRIVDVYRAFRDEPGFAKVATAADVRLKDYSIAIRLYTESVQINGDKEGTGTTNGEASLAAWLQSRKDTAKALATVLPSMPISNGTSRPAEAGFSGLLKKWPRSSHVRFGDVVENINESVIDPAAAGIDRFVGLEHLEPGSLHVRTWGDVSDGTTFTRRCRPGHVLFGKRRAYQRKVAIAEFDAVVSGDIYVLKAKEGLCPELLPFICLSERFFQHAVGTSAGSLSPRTNWSSLASFECDLPALEQQRRCADLLWAGDTAENIGQQLQQTLTDLRRAMLRETFGHPDKYPSAVRQGSRYCTAWPPAGAAIPDWEVHEAISPGGQRDGWVYRLF